MARCFPGTVLLEGTTLSEGRGTTTPLEVVGAPDLPVQDIMDELNPGLPGAMEGVLIRPNYFSPTFHKHAGKLCTGLQIHTDYPQYRHDVFRPFRLIARFLKALRTAAPDYDIWRYHEYEYELKRTPIDVINGGPWLRLWIEDKNLDYADLDRELEQALSEWRTIRALHLIYP